MWKKLERSWIAAYVLLQVAAYRLIGKRYRYAYDMPTVQPNEVLTRSQRLFCLLFPLLATLGVTVTLAGVWVYAYTHFSPPIAPRAYYGTAPLWHIALQALVITLPLFASPAYFDLRRAIRLLTEPTHQPPEQPQEQAGGRERPQ
jgi:hypothetical protein